MPWQDGPIKKQFTEANLTEVLEQGERGTLSAYSHWQIVQWCHDYVEHWRAAGQLTPLAELADEVVVQWELYLASHYTIYQMQRFSQSDLLLPKEYFSQWLKDIDPVSCNH